MKKATAISCVFLDIGPQNSRALSGIEKGGSCFDSKC